MEAEKIAAGLSERDRQWIADWPEASLSGWWFTARDVGVGPKRLWALFYAELLTRDWINNRRCYQWTDLGRAVAAALRQGMTPERQPDERP
jgi:hypothetical protein